MKFKQLNGHIASKLKQIDLIDQSLNNRNELKIAKEPQFNQKTVHSTINKASKQMIADQLFIGPKKSNLQNFQQESASTRHSKLQPNSCQGTAMQNQSFAGYQRITEALCDNTFFSDKKFDNRKSSIFTPNRRDLVDYNDRSSDVHLNQSNLSSNNNASHDLPPEMRKAVFQNKLAAMNGQIILNLNQSNIMNEPQYSPTR